MTDDAGIERVRAERDLFRTLLDLAAHDDVSVFVAEVVGRLAELTGARLAYVALEPGCAGPAPAWSCSTTPNEAWAVRDLISGGLMDAALERGVVHTDNASRDPEYRDRASVRRHRIEAVICAAIRGRADSEPVGVVYLQGRAVPGLFTEADVALVRLAAVHLAPIARRVLTQQRRVDDGDPTAEVRGRLRQHEGVRGRSQAVASVLRHVSVCARSPLPVLLTGETGTGKSLVARLVHDNSAVRTGRFVSLNCATLVPDRAIADLFGARSGSYTGLTRDRPGLAAEARNGTLFLDEVGELPLEVQAQLLTFLQDRTYRWLGDTRVEHAEGVRVIAATHQDLEARARDGRFREDLFHRLAGFPIRVPSLSERVEDVVLLASDAVVRVAQRMLREELPWSPEGAAWLETARWPGNVRQLETVVERALLWAYDEGATAIGPRHLDPTRPGAPDTAYDLRAATDGYRRRYVARVLEGAEGNRTEAARRLGVSRTHLHELIRSFDL